MGIDEEALHVLDNLIASANTSLPDSKFWEIPRTETPCTWYWGCRASSESVEMTAYMIQLGLERSSWRGGGECEVALEAEELEGRVRLDAGHSCGPASPLHVQPERDKLPGRHHRHHQQLESCGRRRRLEAWRL